MKNFANNTSGFVNLTFVFVLMIFLSLYLTATFAIALSQQRDYVRTTCIHEATNDQIAHLQNARALFALNSQSTTLRSSIATTKVALAVALMTGRLEAIPPLQKMLNGLYKAQNTLDGVQKTIISKARIELQAKHLALISKIISGQLETASSWRYMITMSSYFVSRSSPSFAIRPDPEGGVGPNYEWAENAETKLKLAYGWNMFFKTSEQYQGFLTWINVLSLQCSVSADLRGEKWILKINADK